MSDTEPLDLDAIEERALAATPGAWAYDQIPETGECRVIWDGNEAAERDSVYAITSGGSLACNAEFIAHAREDVPALIAEVRRLRDTTELEHRLVTAVSAALWNVSNYPRKAQIHMLGQDTAPLSTKVAGAVIEQLDEHFGKDTA